MAFGAVLFYYEEFGMHIFVLYALWTIDMATNCVCLYLNFVFATPLYKKVCSICHDSCQSGLRSCAASRVLKEVERQQSELERTRSVSSLDNAFNKDFATAVAKNTTKQLKTGEQSMTVVDNTAEASQADQAYQAYQVELRTAQNLTCGECEQQRPRRQGKVDKTDGYWYCDECWDYWENDLEYE
eukprot:CAMPEP_0197020858 /NCGR_PEP_ID=MMETSP1384-20130603/1722_1 /TAXON_ID=29189 /ORGANISM="Ammonia sp." /LENGTH=184 /DNA_ID=CAMNT_0042448565 /DNA_START=369 /DNA_END=923 /DNA_ORIENTATION=+